MDDARLAYRIRVLPGQLERARRHYAALVAEARRYRMTDILTSPERVNEAWEREILGARIDAADRGGEVRMGVDSL